MLHDRRLLLLTVASVLLFTHLAAGQAPAKQMDAKAVAALIEQLGSAEYKQRETATRALEGIGRPALAALREAAEKHADAEVRRRAKGLVEKIENSLEQLLEDYRAYGLPLPPKDVPLVRFQHAGRVIVNGVEQPPTYGIGFLLKPGAEKKPPVILVGTERYEPERNPSITLLDPTRDTARQIEASVVIADIDQFPVAIQCKASGWDSLALTLFANRANKLKKRTPEIELRRQAWSYWTWRLQEPDTDWPTAAKHLRDLIRDDPGLDTLPNRGLLKSLDLALVPSKAKPGSIKALIDELVNLQTAYLHVGSKPDPRYVRLLEMGFKAVPALIEHLDDNRLTRYRDPGFNNFHGYYYRVGHVASDLLEGLAGENLGQGGMRSVVGELARKEKARAWWEEAKKVGEEAYALAHVLPKGRDLPDDHLLWLLLKKYPQHLPTLYRCVLDERPKMRSGTVANAIALSELPRQRKVKLLIYGARHESKDHRQDAFDAIADLEHELFVEVLSKMLDELPRTPKGSYWRCPEQAVVSLVLRTEDARVWKALDKAARRVDVGLRLQLLRRVANDGDEDQRRKERLVFLRSFLDDATLRDVNSDPNRFVAVPAGDDFPRLEVRNYAALEIGRLLKLDRTPLPSWDDAQWARFRDEVREALKR